MESEATIAEKLEINEKIIQIFSESLPHLNNDNDRNDSPNVANFFSLNLILFLVRCKYLTNFCLYRVLF